MSGASFAIIAIFAIKLNARSDPGLDRVHLYYERFFGAPLWAEPEPLVGGIAISAKVVWSVASLGVVAAAGAGAYWWTQSHTKQEQWAVVQKYCFECHNQDDLAGGRAFDRLSPDHIAADAEAWELAIRKVRGGLMPPAGARRPDGETLDGLASWLAAEIDAVADEPPAGRVAFL